MMIIPYYQTTVFKKSDKQDEPKMNHPKQTRHPDPSDPSPEPTEIDISAIQSILKTNKQEIKLGLTMCARCSLCAESCFLYMSRGHAPEYMPSYKFLNSVGKLYKKKGRVDRKALEKMRDLVFYNCVLCTRCYCPFGIDIPSLINLGRQICRSQGLFREYDAPDPPVPHT
jgi:heterodisulfide reductase subunit C